MFAYKKNRFTAHQHIEIVYEIIKLNDTRHVN